MALQTKRGRRRQKLTDVITASSASVAPVTAIAEKEGVPTVTTGTSVCVSERGYFVTALHVVDGAISTFIVHGELLRTGVVEVDSEHDLALLVVRTPTREFVPLRLTDRLPRLGTLVAGLGYPSDTLAVSLSAYFAAFAGRFVDGVDPKHPGVNCPSLPHGVYFTGSGLNLPGFSGGPVVDASGAMIAMTNFGDGDEFVAGTKSGDVLEFISRNVR